MRKIKKKLKKNEQSLRDLCDKGKNINTCAVGEGEGRRRRRERENLESSKTKITRYVQANNIMIDS